MLDPKYVVITAASYAAVNWAGALDNMGGFAQELFDGIDVLTIRYAVVLLGLMPGALVFMQMYEIYQVLSRPWRSTVDQRLIPAC